MLYSWVPLSTGNSLIASRHMTSMFRAPVGASGTSGAKKWTIFPLFSSPPSWHLLLGQFLLCLIAGTLAAAPVLVESLPRPSSAAECVVDAVGHFDEPSLKVMRKRCVELYNRNHVELFVVILEETLESPPQFAEQLFAHWKVGQKTDGRGLLLVKITKGDHVELVKGHGLENVGLDQFVQKDDGNHQGTQLKLEGFGDGLTRSLEDQGMVVESSDSALEASESKSGKTQKRRSRTPRDADSLKTGVDKSGSRAGFELTGGLVLGWLIVLLLAAGLGYVLKRSKVEEEFIHGCEHCGGHHPHFEETQEDHNLSEGQRIEQQIGSVRYRLYRCPHCAHQRALAFVQWSVQLKQCPQCLLRLMRISVRTTVAATEGHNGVQKVTEDCLYCEFHSVIERTVFAPRKRARPSAIGLQTSS